MAQYTKQTGENGAVRYRDGSKFVKNTDLPDNVKKVLDENRDGVIVDELGDIVDPTTETDEGSGDEELAPKTTPPVEDETTPDDEDEDETPAPAPAKKSSKKVEIGAMGFPAKNGKTLSIFSDVPHETVKNVGGIMVPMTMLELRGDEAKGVEPKNDAEIIERLKELKKI